MYQTHYEKRDASEKVEKLENRIGLLKRKEQSLRRDLKIKKHLDK